jgi:hypothetical protein
MNFAVVGQGFKFLSGQPVDSHYYSRNMQLLVFFQLYIVFTDCLLVLLTKIRGEK